MVKTAQNGNFVRVGLAVFVFRDGKFLMMQRQGAHGSGTWAPPGGHLEFGESFEDTARREVMEETGMEITNVRFGGVTNDYFGEEGRHYVTIWMLSEWQANEPHITEPDKCLAQAWQSFDDPLPEQLFLPLQQLLISQFIDNIKQEAAV